MSATSLTQRTRISLAPGHAGEERRALSGRAGARSGRGALSGRGGAYQRGVLSKRGFQATR